MRNEISKNFNFIDKLFVTIFSLTPLIFLLGVAINNIISILFSFLGIYILFIKKRYELINNYFFYFFFIFIFILFISSFFYIPNLANSLKSSLSYAPYFFYFIGGVYLFSKFELKNFQYIYLSICFSILILFIISLLDYFSLIDRFIDREFNVRYLSNKEGFKGIFENKILGFFIYQIYPLLIGLIIFLKKRFNFINIFLLFICAILVFISFSRTSIILFILMNIILFFLFSDKLLNLKSIILIFSGIIISIPILTSEMFVQNFEKTKKQLIKNDSFQIYPDHYIGHYKSTFQMIKKYPLSGTGTDSFRYVCDDQDFIYYYDINYDNDQIKKLNSCSTHPHNYFLQIFSENGLFAFLVLSLFYLFIIKEIIYYIVKKPNNFSSLYCLCVVSVFINFFPLAPSHSFHSTYINGIIYFPITYIIFYNLKFRINKIK